MATINMHMKFEIEIPKETWLMLRKPCRLQTDGRTDGRTDKVNPVYPPPTSLGRGIKISIYFSLKFVPKGPIDNKSALVQIMACRLFGAQPLPEPMLTQFTNAYMRH